MHIYMCIHAYVCVYTYNSMEAYNQPVLYLIFSWKRFVQLIKTNKWLIKFPTELNNIYYPVTIS